MSEPIRYGQCKCPKCGMVTSSSIHDKCYCDREIDLKPTEIKKELDEANYDRIMSEASKIYEYQKSVGNAYAMHQAVEWANKRINNP